MAGLLAAGVGIRETPRLEISRPINIENAKYVHYYGDSGKFDVVVEEARE